MRLAFASLASLMLIAQPVLASTCTQPQDVAALKVASLKSELMVTALTCHDSARYNQFMARFQTDIASNEKALQAYFSRAYGRAGVTRHDGYISDLANAQSSEGLSEGTNLCLTNEPMFDEVMSLPSGNDLPDYAAGKNLAQPLVAVACEDVPVSETRTVVKVSRHRAKHKVA